jgi:ADP-ribosylglycohydrolase
MSNTEEELLNIFLYQQIEKVVNNISLHVIKENLPAFKTVQTLLNNLQSNMNEEKFYSVYKSNKAIASRLLSCHEAIDILLAVNFEDIGECYRLERPTSNEEFQRVQNIIKFAHSALSKMIANVESSMMIEPNGELWANHALSTQEMYLLELNNLKIQKQLGNVNEKILRISTNEIEDSIIGTLLGMTCGDILGLSVKMSEKNNSNQNFTYPYSFQVPQTLTIAESILEAKDLHPNYLALNYALSYSQFEEKCFCNEGVKGVFKALQKKIEWKKAVLYGSAEKTFDCPMLMIPVVIAFRSCVDLVLLNAINVGLCCTHSNKDGLDGSFIFGLAIKELLSVNDIDQFDSKSFIQNLTNGARSVAMRTRLLHIITLLEKIEANKNLDLDNQFVKSFSQDILTHAFESCSVALWFFSKYYKNPTLCLSHAINFGNEPHTIGAMVGALLGALYGTDWLPRDWVEKVANNEAYSKDKIVKIAQSLGSLNFEFYAMPPDLGKA